ncbi:biotin-dependent carboxyltransferase family protein [Peptococcaceae bacterium]|nr:biotin-dependent carboxyltransferase family protein [Peptococcaceae bacterium]
MIKKSNMPIQNQIMPVFEVISPGTLATVQDTGRFGYQKYGITTSGAMDIYALCTANMLLKNNKTFVALEITATGFKIKALFKTAVAICGADLSAAIYDSKSNTIKKAPLWKSFVIQKDQVLSFENIVSGRYAYLAVQGGIYVKEVLGSKATYLQASLGGYEGRALKKGDIIYAYKPTTTYTALRLSPKAIPNYKNHLTARVILGPQHRHFTAAGLKTFLSSVYTVALSSSRMGYRLEGAKVEHKSPYREPTSEATAPGSIQVPPDGQPIILLADRQTIGGYAKIATVISVDLPAVAQLLPKSTISFKPVSLKEAQKLYIKQHRFFKKLEIAANAVF